MATLEFTSYQVLYDSTLIKIKSYDFVKISMVDVYQILFDYIRPASVKFECCKQDLALRDDIIQSFPFVLTDTEIEILSYLMAIEYIDSNYIRVPSMLKETLPSKEFTAHSKGNLLEKVVAARKVFKAEVDQLMSTYSIKGGNFVKKPVVSEL